GADALADLALHLDVGRLGRGSLLGQLAALEFPLLTPAVQELDVVEAQVLDEPVRVGGEPVVVAPVQDDRRVRTHSGPRQERAQPLLVNVVPSDRRVQIGVPVPPHRIGDVSLRVGSGVLVHLDDADARVVQVLLEPIGLDQCLWVGVIRHYLLLPFCRSMANSFARSDVSPVTEGTDAGRTIWPWGAVWSALRARRALSPRRGQASSYSTNGTGSSSRPCRI